MGISSADIDRLSTESPIVNGMALPAPAAGTAAGVVLNSQAEAAKELNARLQNAAIEAEAPKPETPEAETDKPETGKEDASIEERATARFLRDRPRTRTAASSTRAATCLRD